MSSANLNQRKERLYAARKLIMLGMLINFILVLAKFFAGYFGNSYALIADAVESFFDVISSAVVVFGLTVAAGPPNEKYPYGKGRTETLAGLLVAVFLLIAALSIAAHSVYEIQTPHATPEPFTLLVLLAVIFIKEILYRLFQRSGVALGSSSIQGDAFHQRSDALTSIAAFIGISLAILGGPDTRELTTGLRFLLRS